MVDTNPNNDRKVGINHNNYSAKALTKQIKYRFKSCPDYKKINYEKDDFKNNYGVNDFNILLFI